MRSTLLLLVLLVVATPALAERQIIGSEQDHSLATEAGDCASFFRTTFTSFPVQVSDREQRDIALSGIRQLRVVAGEEGGVSVRGWNRPVARLIVCRHAVAQTRAQGARALGAIEVTHAKGEIAASGPAIDQTQAWWVNMILYVPRRASVDVRARNGGIAIRNMSGDVTAHATSGGISLAQSSGRYRIVTNSGGITLERVSGTVEATSRDGAIALRLPSSDTQSVEARIADQGEILCTKRGCEQGEWGANRRQLRIGEGVPNIRLATTAAPIMIGNVTF